MFKVHISFNLHGNQRCQGYVRECVYRSEPREFSLSLKERYFRWSYWFLNHMGKGIRVWPHFCFMVFYNPKWLRFFCLRTWHECGAVKLVANVQVWLPGAVSVSDVARDQQRSSMCSLQLFHAASCACEIIMWWHMSLWVQGGQVHFLRKVCDKLTFFLEWNRAVWTPRPCVCGCVLPKPS